VVRAHAHARLRDLADGLDAAEMRCARELAASRGGGGVTGSLDVPQAASKQRTRRI
jgi:hypothetical protein